MQCQQATEAMQSNMQQALQEKQKMQHNLEKERLAFRASMSNIGNDSKDVIWKSKVMKLRAELEQLKQDRDSCKRQCTR